MKRYLLGIDQSTQGTKALLFDEEGRILCRKDKAHHQYVNEKGWVGHDGEEIWGNVFLIVKELFECSGISPSDVSGIGITNQRETAIAWDKKTGKPVSHAVVWQCARGEEIVERVRTQVFETYVKASTGLPLSPYFSAAKLSWILENVPEAKKICGSARALHGHNGCLSVVPDDGREII